MSIRRLLRGGEGGGEVCVEAFAYVDLGGGGFCEGMGELWQPHVHVEGFTAMFFCDWLLNWSGLEVAADVFSTCEDVVIPSVGSVRTNSRCCLGLGLELSSTGVGGD